MTQCSDDSASNSPATLKAPSSPVTNKERHTQDCEADAVHLIDDNTDQDASGVETPTATEDNDKLVTQELHNSIVIKHP